MQSIKLKLLRALTTHEAPQKNSADSPHERGLRALSSEHAQLRPCDRPIDRDDVPAGALPKTRIAIRESLFPLFGHQGPGA